MDMLDFAMLINFVSFVVNILSWLRLYRYDAMHKRVARSLLWIIGKRLNMGQLFTPFERTLIQQAINYVKE